MLANKLKVVRESISSRANKGISYTKRNSGFTLIELIIVIILLGIMAVGISGFITLATQTYLNVSERDDLLSNARFVNERLNREVRNAVPNSIREGSNGSTQCLEFMPITASTIYTDIPVAPEPSSETLRVIPFINDAGDPYTCPSSGAQCNDFITVYPLAADASDIYDLSLDKVFTIDNYTLPVAPDKIATITLDTSVTFDQDSPTNRAYIFQQPVAYCLRNVVGVSEVWRYANYNSTSDQTFPPDISSVGTASLMARGVLNLAGAFTVQNATLQRNAVVQIKLTFFRDGEEMVFDNAIHITNIP